MRQSILRSFAPCGYEMSHHLLHGRTIGWLGPCLLIAMIAGACQQPPEAPIDPSALELVRDRVATLGWVGAYEDAALVNTAGMRVWTDCMRARGWIDLEYPPPDSAALIELANRNGRWDPWLFNDPEAAESVGYGFYSLVKIAEPTSASTDEGPYDLDAMPLEEAERFELDAFGEESERISIVDRDGRETSSVPGGGCALAQNMRIWGDPAGERRLQRASADLANQIWVATTSDADLRASLRTWRRCMAADDFIVEDPGDIPEVIQEIYSDGSSTPGAQMAETRLATADVACKESSGLVGAFVSAFNRSYDAEYRNYQNAIQAYREATALAVQNAREVLGIGG